VVYRCAHCRELLTLTDTELSQCSEHADGGVEWSPDEVEWTPMENPDAV
jgi:hypothetical protein